MTYQNKAAEVAIDTDILCVIETCDLVDPPPASTPIAAGKHDQNKLVRTIGERLREARELNNLSQSEAARRLGYSNPSKLSKIEAAADTNSVPLWLICGAARLYEVSVDFLFGISDDWECGLPRSAQTWMLEAWQTARERDMLALQKVHAEVVTTAKVTSELVAAVRGVGDALSVYQQRNPDFPDSPASNVLASRLGRAEAVARDAEVKLQKLRLAPKEAA